MQIYIAEQYDERYMLPVSGNSVVLAWSFVFTSFVSSVKCYLFPDCIIPLVFVVWMRSLYCTSDIFDYILILLTLSESEIKMEVNICFTLNYISQLLRRAKF